MSSRSVNGSFTWMLSVNEREDHHRSLRGDHGTKTLTRRDRVDTDRLRNARPEDAPALTDLWVEFGAYYEAIDPQEFQTPTGDDLVDWMKSDITQDRSGGDELYGVAERDGAVVGYIRAQIFRPQEDAERHVLRTVGVTTVKIDALMVTETARRAGVATELVRHAEAWGASRGATESFVISYAHSVTAVPFYEERMGYTAKTTGYWKPLS
jgi:GNAT superfamily N-acetyltransferase